MWSFSKEEVVDDGRLGLSSFPKRKEASPTTKGGGDSSFNTIDTFEALTETEQDFVNFTFVFEAPPKYRFQAKWMFFFDVDEFIFVPKKSNIKSVVNSLSDYTQFTIVQMPMSNKLCLTEDRDCRFIGYPPSAMASTTMSHVLDRLQLCIAQITPMAHGKWLHHQLLSQHSLCPSRLRSRENDQVQPAIILTPGAIRSGIGIFGVIRFGPLELKFATIGDG
ncbi:hypothetical protein FXO37_31581 [Capsicum annuum]|nr:hypothetical protein FXO37_31581 [Capsicum annuum]